MRILVLHGPNLNLLGRREPHIYGKETLAEVNAKLEALARELGTELVIVQSNHEGVLIDTLHANIDKADGAIINPAGITHYGVPLHDAIAAMPFPVIEVHLSNTGRRRHDPGTGLALLHDRASGGRRDRAREREALIQRPRSPRCACMETK